MGTRRLFDADSHLYEFRARITGVRGEGLWVALDATAFYPEEGGQRADRGTLDGIPVAGLEQEMDGTIWHRLERDPGWILDAEVVGMVDPATRRDHRQHHSGQHILSRAFVELFDAQTRSFHMGEETCTIDIALDALTSERVADAEARANEIVFENRSVRVLIEDRDAGLPLRTVAVEGFDSQHCCGTHVKQTGEIGMIKVLRWEKVKTIERVHFVCGDRALRTFQRVVESVDGAARLFSAGWYDLPQVVEGEIRGARAADRCSREWREKWALLEADRLARESPRLEDGTLWVAAWIEGADADTLRSAANAILGHGLAVALLAGSGESGKRPWVAARSEDLPEGRGLDAKAFLLALLGALGGRGGGSAHFAQGSCPAAEEACRATLARLRNGPQD